MCVMLLEVKYMVFLYLTSFSVEIVFGRHIPLNIQHYRDVLSSPAFQQHTTFSVRLVRNGSLATSLCFNTQFFCT